ncbi:MAG: peptidoglycan DD-metalloendopeptidase family protein [Burkholderiaceae bacterium]|nr:peptidoglycan DD-metalloendopeptidase family protein [Burkholderiaceae bacterium]
MTIVRAGFARGEAIAALPRRCIAVVTVLVLAGCASPHPAPIVHRAPPPAPIAAQPAAAPAPSAAAGAPAPADASAAGGPAAPGAEAIGVQTTPIARGPVETRPLPGAGAAIPAPSNGAPGNLLKTEPKALKQPYSEAALAQMRSSAPASAEPMPPIASVAPSAATTRAPATEAATASAAPAAAAPSGAGASDWIWPASGQVVQDFAQPSSMGISISGKPGDPIVAVNDGRVIFSGAGPRSYGNLVIVKHGDDTLSVYAHNRTLLVKEGQSVKRGQRIAELGSSGTDAPRLHFEIRRDGRPIDPRKVLPAR